MCVARRRGRAQCIISDILGTAMHDFSFPFPLRPYPTFVHQHALSRADQRIHALSNDHIMRLGLHH